MNDQDLNHQLIAVHLDRIFTITLVPGNDAAGEISPDEEDLYDTLDSSFVFQDAEAG